LYIFSLPRNNKSWAKEFLLVFSGREGVREYQTASSRLSALYSSLPARWRVFVFSAVSLVVIATGLCMLVAIKASTLSLELYSLWCSILLGPFAAISILPNEPNGLIIGLVNLFALFAHPIWPNRITMLLTFFASVSWLFSGMAITFIEV